MGNTLYILAGIPGSGKSTWAGHFLKGTVVASTDAIRRSLHGSLKAAHEAKANKEVFKTLHEQIATDLLIEDVVADATSLTWDSRKQLLDIAQGCDADVHLILFTNYDEAFKRNETRDPDEIVPPEAMLVMTKKYQETLDVLENERIFYDSVTLIESVN